MSLLSNELRFTFQHEKAFLGGGSVTCLPERPRVLLCAPSNAAIDELLRRLIKAEPRVQPNLNKGMSRESASRNKRGLLRLF